MEARLTNKYGVIEIEKHAVAQLANKAAMESYGIVGFSRKNKGIVELLIGDNATKGVKVVQLDEKTIEIELFVVMQYGINISTVADNIIERVKYTVEKYTDLDVRMINVNVQGIRVK